MGPRGLSALESLIISLDKNNCLRDIQLILFERTKLEGCGPVYDIHQVDSNWINITERILLLQKRPTVRINDIKIPGFPSFHQWIEKDYSKISAMEADVYPPRKLVGNYLRNRWLSLFSPLKQAKIAKLVNDTVIDIQPSNSEYTIKTHNRQFKKIDEILLTIGHQPTEYSKQLQEWLSFSHNNSGVNLFTSPYPIHKILQLDGLSTKSQIGIRGFGLSMIDIVRSIAQRFGKFEPKRGKAEGYYFNSNQELSSLFVPFSLDGLPLAPKPINANVDKQYQPSEGQLKSMEVKIGNKRTQRSAVDETFLTVPIAEITAEIYQSLVNVKTEVQVEQTDLRSLVEKWLLDPKFEHALIIDKHKTTLQQMNHFTAMALDLEPISLDFCIGQVWRHCQPTIYDKLSYNDCSDDVIAKIIALDERMKRYAYGPPVASMQQLIALTELGIVNLDFVNDPDIELSESGWKIKKDGHEITVTIMINSVLNPPELKSVTSEVVKNLLKNDMIQAVHDDLGIATNSNGYVIDQDGDVLSLAVLGRLAKGTLIGVDAILECFGDRPAQWAEQAALNHTNWLLEHETLK